MKTRRWRAEFFPSVLWLKHPIRARPEASKLRALRFIVCDPHLRRPHANAKISDCVDHVTRSSAFVLV